MEIGVALPLASHFAEEILYALFPPVHERQVPNFGALTLEPFGQESDGKSWVQLRLPFPIQGLEPIAELWDVSTARQLCDGYSTFHLCDSHRIATVPSPATELDLVKLQFEQNVTAVQRAGDGKVKVFLPDFMAVHDRNTWRARPYSRRMAEPLRSAHRLTSGVGDRILDLAVHVLSPANVGATIVWLLKPDTATTKSLGVDHRRDIESLSVTHMRSLAAVRSLCSQNDRAVVVDVDGNVIAYNVELVWPPGPALQVEGGTRHNSAANASKADADAVFFVVSSDGPVSLFFSGQRIASFESGSVQTACSECGGSGQSRDKSKCDSCGGSGRAWVLSPMVEAPLPRRSRRRRAAGIPVLGLGHPATMYFGQGGEIMFESGHDLE